MRSAAARNSAGSTTRAAAARARDDDDFSVDAGVRAGEQVAKDMVAVHIGPDMRMAVVGAPSYFRKRSEPEKPQDLVGHDCINLRLSTHAGLYAWSSKKVAENSGCASKDSSPSMAPARCSMRRSLVFGLAYVPEELAQPHLAKGRLRRVLEDWCLPLFRLPPPLPEPSPAVGRLCAVRRCAALPRLVIPRHTQPIFGPQP